MDESEDRQLPEKMAEAGRIAQQLAEYMAHEIPDAAECSFPLVVNDERYDVLVKWREVIPDAERTEGVGIDEQIEAVSEALNELIQSQPDQRSFSISVERQIDGLRAAITTLTEIAAKDEGNSVDDE